MNDNSIIEILSNKEELEKAFESIQMPRSAYALKRFIIMQHDTREKQYEQCVLEMQIAYDAITTAMIKREIKIEEINEIKGEDKKSQLRRALKIAELHQMERAMLGTTRELICLYNIWKNEFEHHYSFEELQNAQEEYWKKRITRQANQDIAALGRVSQGNLDALRQLELYPELHQDYLADIIGKDEGNALVDNGGE